MLSMLVMTWKWDFLSMDNIVVRWWIVTCLHCVNVTLASQFTEIPCTQFFCIQLLSKARSIDTKVTVGLVWKGDASGLWKCVLFRNIWYQHYIKSFCCALLNWKFLLSWKIFYCRKAAPLCRQRRKMTLPDPETVMPCWNFHVVVPVWLYLIHRRSQLGGYQKRYVAPLHWNKSYNNTVIYNYLSVV